MNGQTQLVQELKQSWIELQIIGVCSPFDNNISAQLVSD